MKKYALLGARETGYGCHRRFNDLHSALESNTKDDKGDKCYDIAIYDDDSSQNFSWGDVFNDDFYEIYDHQGNPIYNKTLDIVFIDTTLKVPSELLKYLDATEGFQLFKHLILKGEQEEELKKQEELRKKEREEYKEYLRIKSLMIKYEN